MSDPEYKPEIWIQRTKMERGRVLALFVNGTSVFEMRDEYDLEEDDVAVKFLLAAYIAGYKMALGASIRD